MGGAAFGTTGPFGKGNGGSEEDDFRFAGNRFSSQPEFPSICICFSTSCSWKRGYLAVETLAWNSRELNKSPGLVRSPGVIVQEVSWSLGSPQLNRDSGSSLFPSVSPCGISPFREEFLRNEEVFLIACIGVNWLQPAETLCRNRMLLSTPISYFLAMFRLTWPPVIVIWCWSPFPEWTVPKLCFPMSQM